jgi:hypothetical protein
MLVLKIIFKKIKKYVQRKIHYCNFKITSIYGEILKPKQRVSPNILKWSGDFSLNL